MGQDAMYLSVAALVIEISGHLDVKLTPWGSDPKDAIYCRGLVYRMFDREIY